MMFGQQYSSPSILALSCIIAAQNKCNNVALVFNLLIFASALHLNEVFLPSNRT